MSDDGHGKVHGRFSIPSVHGSMLRKALLALAAPSRNPDRPENTPTRHQLGLAFLEYLETRPEDTLPSAGGVSATVVMRSSRRRSATATPVARPMSGAAGASATSAPTT